MTWSTTVVPVTVAIAVLGGLAGLGRAQTAGSSAAPQESHEHAQPAPASGPSRGHESMQGHQQMMQQMMQQMRSTDDRLAVLVKQMNEATGDAKVAAIAQVVTELVAGQRAMHAHMGTMHEHMMPMMMGGRQP
jgi:hypothetical protein